jgi:hypothetical protein
MRDQEIPNNENHIDHTLDNGLDDFLCEGGRRGTGDEMRSEERLSDRDRETNLQ